MRRVSILRQHKEQKEQQKLQTQKKKRNVEAI